MLALLIGLVSGTYSSLFVAAPLVSYLKEREPKFAYSGEAAPTSLTAPGDDDTPITPRAAKRAAAARRPTGPATPSGAIPPRPRKKKR